MAKHFFPLIRLTSPFYLKLFFTSGFIGKRNMNLLIYVNIYGFLQRNKILITTCKTTIKMLNSVWNFTWLKIKLCNKKEEEINMSSFLSEYPDQQCHHFMLQWHNLPKYKNAWINTCLYLINVKDEVYK